MYIHEGCYITCDRCGAEVPIDYTISTDDEVLCLDCAEDEGIVEDEEV